MAETLKYLDGVKYAYYPNSGTYTVADRPGYLHAVITGVASPGSTITVYDNPSSASGDILTSISSGVSPHSHSFGGIPFKNGLTFVASASVRITVIYE